MKILSLNCWGGRLLSDLIPFVRAHAADVDVFCFQEVTRHPEPGEAPMRFPDADFGLFDALRAELPDFDHRYASIHGTQFGQATFVRPGLPVAASFERFVYLDGPCSGACNGHSGEHGRNVLVTDLAGGVRIANFHGLWKKGVGKWDLPERLEQSERLLAALGPLGRPTVLVGDFNLDPDTESLAMLERAGLRNLCRETGVTSTRTHHFPAEYSPFADYALVTPGIRVRRFEVLPDVVSDHRPLLLEIDA